MINSARLTRTQRMSPSSEPTNGKFIRGLGLLDSTMLVAGSMIGSGIFIVSSIIARQVGAPGWLLVVWLVTGLLTLMAALSYGELAAMMPKAGGQYVYLREAFSPLWGFLYGWTLFLVIQTGTIAAVAVGFARYTGVLVPWVSESNYLIEPIRFGGYALLALDGAVRRPGDDRAADVHEHARLKSGQARPERFHDGEDGRAHRAHSARHHRRSGDRARARRTSATCGRCAAICRMSRQG